MRVFSFSQESTRYCNYSKDKFGNELTFIIPCWTDESLLKEIKGTIINKDDYGSLICEYYYRLSGKQEEWFKPWPITPEKNFIVSLQIAEQLYLELLNQGWKPQQARVVLPNALKTELVMTGFVDDWKDFFRLRCDNSAHPSASELAIPLKEEFIKRGYVDLD
ncbi:FAD-dependent thymidylate synthase [Intestinibacter sp.]|uniref:FAD-dependent thymidylate synthase n=1 Tax=Intestinibacter sp. TaxID=1965304 RepID=UPI003F18BCA4